MQRDPDQALKRQLLFEELQKTQAQAAAMAAVPEPPFIAHGALATECRKAADIMAKLRALDGFEL